MKLGLQIPQAASTTLSWWKRLRSAVVEHKRAGMDSLVALVSWHVWKERNARCFRASATSVPNLLQVIHDEGQRWIQAGACRLGASQ